MPSSSVPIITPTAVVSSPRSSKSSKTVSATPQQMMTSQQYLWIFMVLAIVVSVVLLWIAKDHGTLHPQFNWPSWSSSGLFWAIILVLVFLVAGYYSYVGSTVSSEARGILLVLFIAVAVVYAVAFWMQYRRFSFNTAFYLMLLATALVLVHTFYAWKVKPMAAYGQLPLLVFSIAVTWHFWRSANSVTT